MLSSKTFVVEGPPQPKERPRRGFNGRWYTPKATAAYEHKVGACALAAGLRPDAAESHAGEYRVVVRLWFKDRRRRDVDNVVKSILDGLNGIAFVDDSQIAEMTVQRNMDRDCPRAEITVELTDGREAGDG